MVLVTTPLLTSSSLRGEQLEAAIHGLGRCWAILNFLEKRKIPLAQVSREKICICHRWEAGCKISDREVSGRRWSTWRDAYSLSKWHPTIESIRCEKKRQLSLTLHTMNSENLLSPFSMVHSVSIQNFELPNIKTQSC